MQERSLLSLVTLLTCAGAVLLSLLGFPSCDRGTTIIRSDVTDGTPRCGLSRSTIDFGEVGVTDSFVVAFEIRNRGDGGILTGTVVLVDSTTAFAVVDGGGRFSLAPGPARNVSIAFRPSQLGDATAEVLLGSLCGSVSVSGRGGKPPACEVTPASVDFGLVNLGTTEERIVTIQNTGGSLLRGEVALSCSDAFLVVENGGPYSLSGGETLEVRVRFVPTTAGAYNCGLGIGSRCPEITLSGFGQGTPDCLVTPLSADFGTIIAGSGSSTTRQFQLKNVGQALLNVALQESCGDFSIVGPTSFTLGLSESTMVSVRFRPQASSCELIQCDILTGVPSCAPFAAQGTAKVTFTSDVNDIMQQEGCRSCHAAPEMTYPWLVDLVNLSNPESSRLLTYPTDAAHDGQSVSGCFASGESCYNTVLCWIRTGADP